MRALLALTMIGVAMSHTIQGTVAGEAGQPADVAPSAYLYRADRAPEQNPPESWLLLIQHAGLPYDKPADPNAPAVRKVLCGLLWEEVRPVRRVELSWPADARGVPTPDEVALSYFDATDGHAHTWWNPRTVKEAGKPEVSADGRAYSYAIPVDTWGVVVSARGAKNASDFTPPTLRAFVADTWKTLDIEIEWGFDPATAALDCDGRIEPYDALISNLRPLAADAGTTMAGPLAWRSAKKGEGRRGIQLSALYIGSSRWRRVWPYHAQPEDVARSIITVWTKAGSFSFLVADLERGPILAPEYGFFIRATSKPQATPVQPPRPPAAQPLGDKMDAIPGVPKVRGWATNVIPWFGVNPDATAGSAGNLTIPARSAAMHPSPERDVAVGWRSPLKGRVAVAGKVASGDSKGGNGVEWSLVHDAKAAQRVLARGAINPGGSQALAAEAAVEVSDQLSLVVSAKGGNHICDTTIVELAITEAGGQGRVWNLVKDVADNVHAGNPHADAQGNAAVWLFCSVAHEGAPAAASEPPFPTASEAASAKDFLKELAAKGLATIRQRVRKHPDQTWEGAVGAMHPGRSFPPHPKPPFEPAMQVELPCERLTAQWKLGAWHILRRSVKDANGAWRFNDFPFGILASETYMFLRALDLQGMHKEAADGLDQWLSLPMQPRASAGTHGNSRPDRPLGHFSDGTGCLTHATGPNGAGGHMDAVHSMGPGAIAFALTEHFLLTGDMAWLKAAAPRMKANAEWMLRQRQLLASIIPGGQRLWSKGLQPAHVVTPDSACMHMQFYESEAYYWLAVKRMADLLALIDPAEGARMAAEAEAYRKDLVAAIERSIALSPVVQVRDGTYRSFIPFAPYVRGFAAGAWGWKRCQGHVGAIYWDTVQSADPLLSPAGLLAPTDPRVQGHLDVLEDRLLLENSKIRERKPAFDPEKDWFAQASWQYQCGLERHANIHLAADDPPNAIRSMMNQYAVDIMPGDYTFREHTTGGPADKPYEESCFLERLRMLLVMEEAENLWLARATPRAWLEQGKRIAVKNAPTHFGPVDYELVSDAANGRIAATVKLPSRTPPKAVLLRLRHPKAAPLKAVLLNGAPWKGFDPDKELIRIEGVKGTVAIQASY
ncbi:MAG: hypothetical protein FJ291_04290 [Planctomycetes bacterium]|nr:hypothetical protein [Planctomycetota bacterium]